jgi:hypothetical protein
MIMRDMRSFLRGCLRRQAPQPLVAGARWQGTTKPGDPALPVRIPRWQHRQIRQLVHISGTAVATVILRGVEHKVIHDELAMAVEQIVEASLSFMVDSRCTAVSASAVVAGLSRLGISGIASINQRPKIVRQNLLKDILGRHLEPSGLLEQQGIYFFLIIGSCALSCSASLPVR